MCMHINGLMMQSGIGGLYMRQTDLSQSKLSWWSPLTTTSHIAIMKVMLNVKSWITASININSIAQFADYLTDVFPSACSTALSRNISLRTIYTNTQHT